jgi:hypothetical protein
MSQLAARRCCGSAGRLTSNQKSEIVTQKSINPSVEKLDTRKQFTDPRD